MEKVKYIDSGINEPREQKKMLNLCLVTKPSSLACRLSLQTVFGSHYTLVSYADLL